MTIASASKTEKKTKTRVSTSDLGCNALGESELLSASVPLLIMDLFRSPIISPFFLTLFRLALSKFKRIKISSDPSGGLNKRTNT